MARRAISGMIARYVEGLPEIATQFPAYNHQVFCLTAYGLLPPEHAAADRGRTDPLHINRQSGIVMADITAYAHLLSYQGADVLHFVSRTIFFLAQRHVDSNRGWGKIEYEVPESGYPALIRHQH